MPLHVLPHEPDMDNCTCMLLCRIIGAACGTGAELHAPTSLIEAPAEHAMPGPEAPHPPDRPLSVPQAWWIAWAAWMRSWRGRMCRP